MNYKNIYWKLYNEGQHVELLNRINEELYANMMDLPDPELYELLSGLNPSAEINVLFLWNGEEVQNAFPNSAELVEIVRKHNLDLTKNFLIHDGESDYQTVDRVSDLAIDWGEVFDDAVEELIWDYCPNDDEDMENYERLQGLFEEAEMIVNGGRIYTAYAPDNDTTFIMKESINGTEHTIECVGWYAGEPNEEATETYKNYGLKATL